MLNAGLEARVQQRTEQLLRAIQQAELLNLLSRQLEQASSVSDLMRLGLPVLARLTGYAACAAWYPHAGDHSPALGCYQQDGAAIDGATAAGTRRGGVSVQCDVNGQTLTIHAFDPQGVQRSQPDTVPLLESAAQSIAVNLSRHLHMQAMERTALTDEDTGLGNRQAFLSDLSAELAYATRHRSGFVLSVVEVANIRFLNATIGYAGGNDLIGRLARVLDGVRRTEDRAYRLNGATFACLLRLPSGVNRISALRGWQDRLQGTLADFVASAPFPLDVQYSDTVCPDHAGGVSEMFRVALDSLQPLTGPPATDRRYHG